MKLLLVLLLFFNAINIVGQRTTVINNIKEKLRLKENCLYIFCRGTTMKTALIAHAFNNADTNITHIGIGFMEAGSLLIYNVTDNRSKESALVIDSLESFISSPDVYYLSVWEMKTSVDELENVKKSCHDYTSRRIYFDATFNINEDDTLYCSEFCVRMLQTGNAQLNFKPMSLVLHNTLYEAFLDRKILVYYPVDFFESDLRFRKIFSYLFTE